MHINLILYCLSTSEWVLFFSTLLPLFSYIVQLIEWRDVFEQHFYHQPDGRSIYVLFHSLRWNWENFHGEKWFLSFDVFAFFLAFHISFLAAESKERNYVGRNFLKKFSIHIYFFFLQLLSMNLWQHSSWIGAALAATAGYTNSNDSSRRQPVLIISNVKRTNGTIYFHTCTQNIYCIC